LQKITLMPKWIFIFLICFISINSYSQSVYESQKICLVNLESADSILKDNLTTYHFIQMEPQSGKPSPDSTSLFLGFDSIAVVLYMICYQAPNSIVSRLQTRDILSKDDDGITLILDTYNDGRTGYGFLINPTGTQTDFIISDDGRTISTDWDTEWHSETSLFEKGWKILIRIPFSSIKYKKNIGEWGLNVGRVVRNRFETSWWSGLINNDFRISQGGKLTGIEYPHTKDHFSLFPYTTLQYKKSEYPNNQQDYNIDAGADMKIQLSSTIQANLTYNPDFATVEGDEEQINLSRYELQYPEKRLFFQEGNEMFRTRIRTFYSRRIGDIDYGIKLNGKAGKYGFNALSVKSRIDQDFDTSGAFYSAINIKRDIFKSSNIGFTLVDKSWDGEYARTAGMNYIVNLGNSWKFTGQFVTSAPGDFKSHSAYFVRFAKESNIYHYHIRYSNIGENFKDNVNQTGFITDDDRHELDSDISYKWWIKKSRIYKYINAETRNNIFWNHGGTLKSWYFTESLRFYLKNLFSIDLEYNNEFKLFEKKYYNNKSGITLGYNTDEWSSAEIEYQQGINFNRDFTLVSFEAKSKLSKKLIIDYEGNHLKFVTDSNTTTKWINILSLNYYFTRNTWIRIFAQNNTGDDHVYVYGFMAWRFKPPFGAVYLIYSMDDMLYIPGEKNYLEQILFLKLTYPLNF